MTNSKIRIKTEHDVEATLGIKKEKIVTATKAAAPAQKPIVKSNSRAWNEEKQKLIDKIANLQSENQRTVLKLKEKEAECTSKTLENQNLQQSFSALSNEHSSLRSELLNAKNESTASKNTISNLKSENRKLCAVIKQLKSGSANSNANHFGPDNAIDDLYEVEKLLAHKNKKDGVHYLVRWKNYSAEDDTWQKESDLQCPKILKEYKRTKMNQKY